MRNKVLVLMIICCVLCSAIGCGKEEPPKEVIEFKDVIPEEVPVILRDENRTEEPVTDEEETEAETAVEEEVIPYCDRNIVVYSVSMETYEEGAFSISYPVVTDMEDADLMERINTTIKEQLLEEDILSDENYLTYEASTEIATQGSGILSFVCRGYEEYQGAAHPSQFVKTMNIDMSNGKNVRLKDYADLETIVSNLELATGYTIMGGEVDPDDFSAFLNNGYVTDYAMTLLDFDIDFGQTEYIQTGYSYIKDNHPVLCIEVEHAMGDYVEVCFDMQIK